jgi:hypothetical protein
MVWPPAPLSAGWPTRYSSPVRNLSREVIILAAVLSLSGCKYSAALGKQEWVVIFKPAATQAQHQLVLAACSGIPHVQPEPIGNGRLVSELAANVRFRTDRATDADLAQLVTCFQRFDFIQSYDPTDFGH